MENKPITQKSKFMFEYIDGLLYLNLGSSSLSEAVAMMLVALHGGHSINRNGSFYYYNGAANENIYLDVYARYMVSA